ncbi:unnamed protein product [Caenorhabditis angaria]|uniref:maleylacetoacetate isomerase n=1 Tax=Caenorhabditis angaria TaxID=860376 RepID=A0A9P1J4D5_9PELO|nr:unnamed protein product [Caenorhabditis angaria]
MSDKQQQKPILYSYWRSSCAWRVRIALAIKGIEYDYKTVNLLSQEELNAPEFVKINPAKRVPALVVNNGEAITESLAIVEYLEDIHPENSLFPKDPVKRAYAREIALHITSGMQPLQNSSVLKFLNTKEAGSGAKWAQHWLTVGFGALEQLLAKHSGKYCVGDEVTVADLCIPSIVYNANRFNIDLTPFPNVKRIDSNLAILPEFIAAIPDNQPDAGLNA